MIPLVFWGMVGYSLLHLISDLSVFLFLSSALLPDL